MRPDRPRVVRAALTETKNAYADMPDMERLDDLADRLEDVRRANVEHHLDLIEAASLRGARIVGLGELFPAPYFALRRDAFFRKLAEDAGSGPTVARLSACARELGVVLVAPIYERAGEERFNTAVVIDADGRRVGAYRKCHIPRGSNERGGFDETFYYRASDGRQNEGAGRGVGGINRYLPVFETAAGRVGVAICYDRHFEGVFSGLARGGAEIVFSPAVTFGEKSSRLWEMEFAVEAARNRIYIGASNRKGAEPPWNQTYFGRSHFVGPEGPIENRSDHENLIVADLDLDSLSAPDPSGWNIQRDRRPEVTRSGEG